MHKYLSDSIVFQMFGIFVLSFIPHLEKNLSRSQTAYLSDNREIWNLWDNTFAFCAAGGGVVFSF